MYELPLVNDLSMVITGYIGKKKAKGHIILLSRSYIYQDML